MSTLYLVLCSAFLFVSNFGFAQRNITGKTQSADGQPLAFANILLLNAKDSSVVKGAVANEAGLFSFEGIRPNYYLVVTSRIGYQNTYSAPFIVKEAEGTYQLPLLTAIALEKQLNEVKVIAQKPIFEQQLDKLVINPSAMITAAGGSVLDVLERSPGVQVDRQNGTISLGGKSGVMVMLNGKLSRLPLETLVQMLSGMNADNVETVELIANPSARYDAEGNAGLINIVLKRKQGEGTNGSFSLMAGYGRFAKNNGSFSINHNQGSVSLFATISYNYDRNWFDFLPIRTQQVQGAGWQNQQYSDRYPINKSADFRVGVDISLTKRTVLSAQVQGLLNNRHVISFNSSNTRIAGQSQPFTASELTWMEDTPWRNGGVSMGLSHTTARQHTLTIDADYQLYENNGLNTFDITRFITTDPLIVPVKSMKTTKETGIRFWVVRTDYTRPLGKNWKMESGFKINLSYIDNALGVERNRDGITTIDPELTSKALFRETIGAAYANFTGKLGPKTDFQGGLRAENTQTHIQSADGKPLLNRHYLNLFPSASFKHQIGKLHALNVAYSRRLTRPVFTELIPNFYITDPNTYYVGNIALKPAYNSSLRVGYAFKGAYFFRVGYSHERDVINKHQPVTYPGRPELIHITQNFDRSDVVSVEATFPLTLAAWWKVQSNLAGYYRSSQSQFDIGPFSQRIYYGTINSVHTFTLGNRWTAECNVLYLSLIPAGVMNLRSKTNVTAGIQKILPNNKGILRLNINDIFWTDILRWYTAFSTQQFDFQAKMKFEPRVVKMTYSRSFGNQKVKTTRQRRGAEEERGRIQF
jgi:hypothetical protein